MILWKMIKILLDLFLQRCSGRKRFSLLYEGDGKGRKGIFTLESRVGFYGIKEGQHQPPSSPIRLVFSTRIPKKGSFLLFHPIFPNSLT